MNDTIAAIATAYGEGGIGIIRISGQEALPILERIFSARGNKPIVERYLSYGHIVDPETKEITDEVLVVYMKAPYTYTTEDIAEIHCHGSVVALRKTLSLVLRSGARLAEPGEFTKRAFLNGRLDLSQAEAVIDVVKAKTDKGFETALGQLEGTVSEAVNEIRKKLMDLLVNVAVNIDYPDEDIEQVTYRQLESQQLSTKERITKITALAKTGKMIKEGLGVVIAGKPNVGKSSLLNALLRESRAIVTEIPGTTRDTIEEGLSIKGIPVRLTDTAGIHETENVIEKKGVEKSKASFNRADLILLVLDGSRDMTKEDKLIISQIGEREALVLINKTDLPQKINIERIEELLPGKKMIETSMKTGTGLSQIEDEIERLVYGGKVYQKNSLLITNTRHLALLEKAEQAIKDALEMTRNKEALDFIEVDLKRAYDYLGEILGETVSEDIIDQVFERFCLGK